MKTSFTSLALGTVLLIAAVANGLAGDDSFMIARSHDIAGKRVSGACLPFAQDLYSRLVRAGGEAHLIVFDWNSATGSGKHAIVVYRDKDGRYWGMDNLQKAPIWLAGSDPKAWAEFFAPRFAVIVKAHQTDPSLAGQYADLSRSRSSQSEVAQVPAKAAPLLAAK